MSVKDFKTAVFKIMPRIMHKEVQTGTLVEMYGAGASLREIAAACGMTYQAVQVRFKKAGVELRPRGQAPDLNRVDRDQLVELYWNRRLPCRQIEKLLNLKNKRLFISFCCTRFPAAVAEKVP